MINENNYKVITTKKDFQEITNKGCIICKCNNFSYYNVLSLYKCNNCNSIYAINMEGVINMLELQIGTVRIYNKEISLIDDDKKDFEIHYEKGKNLIKRKARTSER